MVGAEAIGHLKNQFFEYGRHNLADLVSFERKVVQRGLTNLAELRSELAALEQQVLSYGRASLGDLEKRMAQSVAALLGAKWPVHRWPVYVFMAGAMICMLTSSVCHLLGCCDFHLTQVFWRFDYAAIAVLIVTSFFPPVYYSFLCYPKLRLFYLTSTTLLGAPLGPCAPEALTHARSGLPGCCNQVDLLMPAAERELPRL
jgi:Haemolysin-III related